MEPQRGGKFERNGPVTPEPLVTADPYAAAVRLLTQVASRRNHRGDQADFADFLAQVLAAVAANVGGPDQLLAGRSGSWEASQLADLLQGTMGDDPRDWQRFRTEPVVVSLNIAELIENGDHHPGLMGLDDVIEVIEDRYDSPDLDQDFSAYQGEIDAALARYTEAYRSYGARFEVAVREVAGARGLGVHVVVHIDHDPQSRWWADEVSSNPIELDDDELILELWRAAHDIVPLPNVDIHRGVR